MPELVLAPALDALALVHGEPGPQLRSEHAAGSGIEPEFEPEFALARELELELGLELELAPAGA